MYIYIYISVVVAQLSSLPARQSRKWGDPRGDPNLQRATSLLPRSRKEALSVKSTQSTGYDILPRPPNIPSMKGLMVSIRWYLWSLKGKLGGAGRNCNYGFG